MAGVRVNCDSPPVQKAGSYTPRSYSDRDIPVYWKTFVKLVINGAFPGLQDVVCEAGTWSA